MELFLQNIGKISEATVRLDGITVIAGENDTGKSTVSRAFFSIFNGFNNIEKRIQIAQEENLTSIINQLTRRFLPSVSSPPSLLLANRIDWMLKDITKNAEEYKKDPNLIYESIKKNNDITSLEKGQDSFIDGLVSRLIDSLNVSVEDIFQSAFESELNSEFFDQVQNIYSENDSKIELKLENITISVTLSNGHIIKIEPLSDLHTDVYYIDTPQILDDLGNAAFVQRYGNEDHRLYLIVKLLMKEKNSNIVEEIITNKKLQRIYAMFSEVCDGEIVSMNHGGLGYKKVKNGKPLKLENISSGLKSFVILKKLLQNGSIGMGSVILLDEPEIHLHPEWQLLYAELIVLLHKEFDLQILLNTHSHYFLDAIEVYSEKHDVADKCRFYLASSDGNFATMTDVTGNTEVIYQKLARPLQKLENERYRNED